MSTLISKLMGKGLRVHEDDEDESIIPDRAKKIEVDDNPAPDDETAVSSDFLPTSLALVAPDCTPEAEAPLPTSKVPEGKPPKRVAQDTDTPPELPVPAVDQPAIQTLIGIPSPSEYAATESMGGAGGAFIGEAALQPGVPMPDHKPGDMAKTMGAARRFLRVPR